MKVEIFELKDPLSARIIGSLGPVLSSREAQMFDHAQSVGAVYVATIDTRFVACWGIIPPTFMSDQAYLWFWGPPVRFPMAVLRYSRQVIRAALERYPLLHGHCNCGAASMRWMQWLGAEFGQPRGDLIPFEIRRPTDG